MLKPSFGRTVLQEVRAAEFQQRTAFALIRFDGWGSNTRTEQHVQTLSGVSGHATEIGIERNVMSAARLAVKECAGWNVNAEHFFQTEGLRTELNFVGPVFFRMTALIFDRERCPEAGSFRQGRGGNMAVSVYRSVAPVELDHIGDTGKAEAERADTQGGGGTDVAAAFALGAVDTFVKHVPFGCQAVLCPKILNVNQCALALAEYKVL